MFGMSWLSCAIPYDQHRGLIVCDIYRSTIVVTKPWKYYPAKLGNRELTYSVPRDSEPSDFESILLVYVADYERIGNK